jgi:RNA polymerase sigma-70 factor (ECF subfamily)
MVDDAEAMDIAQLVQDHHEGVYRYAFRLTGSAADAEDLSQQVFLTAQQKLGQLRKAESARSWLFAILRNCFLKGQHKWRPIPAEDIRLDVDRIPIEMPDEGGIDPGQLQEALNQLPESYRLVLAMFYFEDCRYREIAERLELPMGTVMSRLARAKSCLRAKLLESERQEAARVERKSASRRG